MFEFTQNDKYDNNLSGTQSYFQKRTRRFITLLPSPETAEQQNDANAPKCVDGVKFRENRISACRFNSNDDMINIYESLIRYRPMPIVCPASWLITTDIY